MATGSSNGLGDEDPYFSQVVKGRSSSAQIVQTNQISTPALIICLVLPVAISCGALGWAAMAEREAQNAEREARVALNHSEELKTQVEAEKIIIETFGIKSAIKEAVKEK